jgi:tetratricopeptide (TPR) repeat protein
MMTNGSERMSIKTAGRADATGIAVAATRWHIRALPCALCLSALFICGASSETLAQKKPATASRAATTNGQKKPARQRRAVAPTATTETGGANPTNTVATDAEIVKDAKDTTPSVVTASPVADAASSVDDGVESTVSATAASEAETLDSLRAEIKEAKSDTERARLERRFVELLATDATRDETLVELRALLDGTRFDPQFYYNVGNMLARMNDPGAAATAYRKAIKQRKGNYPRALNNLGVVLLRAGDSAEAETAFLDALRQEQFTYPEAHYNLGRLYQARGETELAVRQWRRALRLNPAHTPAALLLANALAADGEEEEALKTLAAARPTDTEARRSIADARVKILEVSATPPVVETVAGTSKDVAGKALTPVASRDRATTAKGDASRYQLDEKSLALLHTARDLRDEGKHAQAAQTYRRVIANQRGGFPPAELELAYALIALRQTPEATQLLTVLAARSGAEFPIAFYHLARLQETAGDLESAAANYTRAVVAHGDRNPQFMLDLARVRERQGDYAAALTALEAYIAANERTGTEIDWTATRLAALKEKAGASK